GVVSEDDLEGVAACELDPGKHLEGGSADGGPRGLELLVDGYGGEESGPVVDAVGGGCGARAALDPCGLDLVVAGGEAGGLPGGGGGGGRGAVAREVAEVAAVAPHGRRPRPGLGVAGLPVVEQGERDHGGGRGRRDVVGLVGLEDGICGVDPGEDVVGADG